MNPWLLGFLGSVGAVVLCFAIGVLGVKGRIVIPKWLGDGLFYAYFGSIIAMVFTLGGALATNFK